MSIPTDPPPKRSTPLSLPPSPTVKPSPPRLDMDAVRKKRETSTIEPSGELFLGASPRSDVSDDEMNPLTQFLTRCPVQNLIHLCFFESMRKQEEDINTIIAKKRFDWSKKKVAKEEVFGKTKITQKDIPPLINLKGKLVHDWYLFPFLYGDLESASPSEAQSFSPLRKNPGWISPRASSSRGSQNSLTRLKRGARKRSSSSERNFFSSYISVSGDDKKGLLTVDLHGINDQVIFIVNKVDDAPSHLSRFSAKAFAAFGHKIQALKQTQLRSNRKRKQPIDINDLYLILNHIHTINTSEADNREASIRLFSHFLDGIILPALQIIILKNNSAVRNLLNLITKLKSIESRSLEDVIELCRKIHVDFTSKGVLDIQPRTPEADINEQLIDPKIQLPLVLNLLRLKNELCPKAPGTPTSARERKKTTPRTSSKASPPSLPTVKPETPTEEAPIPRIPADISILHYFAQATEGKFQEFLNHMPITNLFFLSFYDHKMEESQKINDALKPLPVDQKEAFARKRVFKNTQLDWSKIPSLIDLNTGRLVSDWYLFPIQYVDARASLSGQSHRSSIVDPDTTAQKLLETTDRELAHYQLSNHKRDTFGLLSAEVFPTINAYLKELIPPSRQESQPICFDDLYVLLNSMMKISETFKNLEGTMINAGNQTPISSGDVPSLPEIQKQWQESPTTEDSRKATEDYSTALEVCLQLAKNHFIILQNLLDELIPPALKAMTDEIREAANQLSDLTRSLCQRSFDPDSALAMSQQIHIHFPVSEGDEPIGTRAKLGETAEDLDQKISDPSIQLPFVLYLCELKKWAKDCFTIIEDNS